MRSSRSLEKESHRNVEVKWLIKKLTPDFKTIADFRKDNRDALRRVYKEFTPSAGSGHRLVCKGLGLFGGELIPIHRDRRQQIQGSELQEAEFQPCQADEADKRNRKVPSRTGRE